MPIRARKSAKAEDNVVAYLNDLSEVMHVWKSIRVPDPTRRQGAGEVDCIALTNKGLVLVEVKNWVGALTLEDGDIIQQRMKVHGQRKPVLDVLRKKEVNLKSMAVSIHQDATLETHCVVVFPNIKSNLSEGCKRHPNVSLLKDLELHINSAFERHEPLSAIQIQRYTNMIERMGSWDSISFDGGLVNNGDIHDDLLPLDWHRSKLASVVIELHGGWFKSMIRGLRVKIIKTTWDGESTTEILDPSDLYLKHTMPWASSGIDGRGKHPIIHLNQVKFGNKISFSKAGALLSKPTVEDTGLSTLSKGESNRSQSPTMSQLYAQFQVGNTVTGTIRKHLKDNKGRTYALLVALVERHVTGILYVDKLDQVHPAMFEFFYKVDAPLEVTVTKNDMQGRISLIQNMEE